MRTLIFFILTITSGCPGPSDPIPEACQRADECNAIPGRSADECTDDYETWLSQQASSTQEEFRHAIQECLDHPSCSGFVSCVNVVLGN